MKKFIVITSIFEPTEAVKSYVDLDKYNVIVVGDKKSPKEYMYKNVTFLPVEKTLGYNIEKVLPYNHYCRKMLGYLYAIENNADMIIDTDDDNIPLENFGFPAFKGNYDYIENKSKFVNIYNYYTDKRIWPRGLPLNYIQQNKISLSNDKNEYKIGVWQGLADEDPDVDAIYRLTDNSPCYFNKEVKPIVLEKGIICPFNTQNTAFIKELFPLLYLPATVTFRFTDILKGLIAQPIMWSYGYNLGFTTATVIQKRNEHDYMKDFVSEIPCYIDSERVINIVEKIIKPEESISTNLKLVYQALYENNIVKKEELIILDAWLKDCKKLLNI